MERMEHDRSTVCGVRRLLGLYEGAHTQVRIDQIEAGIDENYVEDPWGEEGQPDLYADVSVNDEPYYNVFSGLNRPFRAYFLRA